VTVGGSGMATLGLLMRSAAAAIPGVERSGLQPTTLIWPPAVLRPRVTALTGLTIQEREGLVLASPSRNGRADRWHICGLSGSAG